MAAKFLCSVLMVFALAILQVDCSCQNKVRLVEFKVMQHGSVVHELPLKPIKNKLSVKVGVYVTNTLNQEWFTLKISATARATLRPFGIKVNMNLPCTLKNGCEFHPMSCMNIQEYLGLNHIGCPIQGPKIYTATVTFEKPVGDLSVHIPSWAKGLVQHVQVKGHLDMWDNHGNQIGCVTASFGFTN